MGIGRLLAALIESLAKLVPLWLARKGGKDAARTEQQDQVIENLEDANRADRGDDTEWNDRVRQFRRRE